MAARYEKDGAGKRVFGGVIGVLLLLATNSPGLMMGEHAGMALIMKAAGGLALLVALFPRWIKTR